MDRGSTETYLRSGRVDQKLVQKYPFLMEAYGRRLDLFDVPCNRCLNCRLSKARTWSQRCILESKSWQDNWFVTLTYDDEHIVPVVNEETGEFINGQLVPSDVTEFLKRLREHFRDKYNHIGIRYYMCGEYGDTTYRPHYHLILFNLPIDDLKLYSKSPLGDVYYNSPLLTEKWGKGHVVVGEVTEQSAAYVARYVMKKAKDDTDYDALGLHKEYTRMSTRPGIALPYLVAHLDEIYERDQIYLANGKVVKPSRYFDDKAKEFGIDIEEVKEKRLAVNNFVSNVKVDMVNREFYSYLDDLEKESVKRSKALTRYL